MAIFLEAPRFNLSIVAQQLAEFRAWLATHRYFKEKDVVAKLRSLGALCPLLGAYDGKKYPTEVDPIGWTGIGVT
ncbi:hypothetical protein [Rhodopila globiformis]|uniref:Uncharacterized protein n=1 Tax=Rhodopila globiformis TaxID=1071 RepID=A0A2S6NMW5_RHOGL|nr:hypothetical protein [Rhodopila globiformis]PPQ37650.1 hypothetical protein CCS01_03210 [Rhodopila globiformis]